MVWECLRWFLVGGIPTPLKNMKVNGKDDIPYMMEIKCLQPPTRFNIIGWKKSCTTLDGWNPKHNGINHLSTGTGFLPSTVSLKNQWWLLIFDDSYIIYIMTVDVTDGSLMLVVVGGSWNSQCVALGKWVECGIQPMLWTIPLADLLFILDRPISRGIPSGNLLHSYWKWPYK